jgi:hypothetical protein
MTRGGKWKGLLKLLQKALMRERIEDQLYYGLLVPQKKWSTMVTKYWFVLGCGVDAPPEAAGIAVKAPARA